MAGEEALQKLMFEDKLWLMCYATDRVRRKIEQGIRSRRAHRREDPPEKQRRAFLLFLFYFGMTIQVK
jgi:hypothetical protein